MDRFPWINLLYDFYGPLLTPRRQRLLELYYEHDLSLGEIAGELKVSRQAVHDTVKRAEESLEHFEQKLGLAAKHLDGKKRIKQALAVLDELDGDRDETLNTALTQVRQVLLEIQERG